MAVNTQCLFLAVVRLYCKLKFVTRFTFFVGHRAPRLVTFQAVVVCAGVPLQKKATLKCGLTFNHIGAGRKPQGGDNARDDQVTNGILLPQ